MKLSKRERDLIKRTFVVYRQTSQFLRDPLILEKAEGLCYWDSDGKRYFDFIGGIFSPSWGIGSRGSWRRCGGSRPSLL
jgi:4-aminobutyrate aminotransferase-like enzyme